MAGSLTLSCFLSAVVSSVSFMTLYLPWQSQMLWRFIFDIMGDCFQGQVPSDLLIMKIDDISESGSKQWIACESRSDFESKAKVRSRPPIWTRDILRKLRFHPSQDGSHSSQNAMPLSTIMSNWPYLQAQNKSMGVASRENLSLHCEIKHLQLNTFQYTTGCVTFCQYPSMKQCLCLQSKCLEGLPKLCNSS